MKLTPQQEKILRLKVRGYHNPDIAERLHISIKTLDTHIQNLLMANDCETIVQMAYEYGKENSK